MEKLKAKHDHKLTDILKVLIFGLFLIMPGIMFLPSCMYYAVNKYATPPTSQIENTTEVEMQQLIENGLPTSMNNWSSDDDNVEYINNSFEFTYDDVLRCNQVFNFSNNDKVMVSYYANVQNNASGVLYTDFGSAEEYIEIIDNELCQYIFTININDTNNFAIAAEENNSNHIFVSKIQIFNLTEIFGANNEPTIEKFNQIFPNDYYDYGTIYYANIPNGTYTTYTDIPKELDLQWQSLWNKPILKWTNTTILKQGLDNFTYVFGITQTSYINNLIVYELIMVAIYIVIDIVLTLFKWLTHIVGEK